MAVFALKNAQALLVPQVQEFMKRVFPKGNLLNPLGFEVNPNPIIEVINSNDKVLLIGVEDGEWKCLSMAGLPDGVGTVDPYSGHFYNEGKAALRNEVLQATVDFVLQNGYTSIVALHSSGKADEPWLRMLKKFGEPTKIGSIYRFKVG